ncbi:alpha/beta fold hydrolase [Flavobacterium pectinovorum]|uniref:alpha/beta hydrolase n=1 Tax=Flavobacterium pectinovorum TaxID=29533 RepID=UPI00265D70E0|nr:alpha/beta fold hydrolase [Flavobacterium pectinovorum]WKL48383.1 alpha/beta fold hydrolase [Flavobacterium pectinovorum]
MKKIKTVNISNVALQFVILLHFLIPFNKIYSQNKSDFGKEINSIEKYNLKEINFMDSEENVKLSGTLLFPKINYSKIVIITPGSGQNNRDSHYIIAEELLRSGIAVYRFDDRGVGKSEGKVNFSVDQIIKDLYYALKNIQKIDSLTSKQIGVLGHSLGGIATIDAYKNELNIDFLILISTPIEKFATFTKPQYSSKSNSKIKLSTQTLFQNLKIPMLFIAGSNDSFFDTKKTAQLINDINNKNIDVKILNGLNHFLRAGTDNWKKTKQYSNLYEIDHQALNEIINWIVKI